MIYQSEQMELDVIWEILHGTANDVVVCRDLRSPTGIYYTVLVVHDRTCLRNLLQIFQQEGQETGKTPYIARFSQNEDMCLVFPYREDRKMSTFAEGQMLTLQDREAVSIHFMIECLSLQLPAPFLRLLLEQDCVQLAKDNSVYITYSLDLSEMDMATGDAQCTMICAELILKLLEGTGRKTHKLKSFRLIRKKLEKKAYKNLPELYRDVKLSALSTEKVGIKRMFAGFVLRNKDLMFHLLLVLCGILILTALAMMISQLIYNDIPWLRLFQTGFEVIGTETLTG